MRSAGTKVKHNSGGHNKRMLASASFAQQPRVTPPYARTFIAPRHADADKEPRACIREEAGLAMLMTFSPISPIIARDFSPLRAAT